MWFKKTLFDPAVKVPLIIADPRRKGGRIAAPVSLLDLFPTICDLGGIGTDRITTPIDGRSLVPALDGAPSSGPILFEHIDGGTAAPRVGFATATGSS